VLALADGTLFPGFSIGAPGETSGEVVFNTALTGYQEIITDPSYSRQIVTLTYPHIGNVGINVQDAESDQIHAAGLVIKDLPKRVSNFRAEDTLGNYLTKAGILGIAGIDTRKLTRILRDKGAQSGAIVAGNLGDDYESLSKKALVLAKAFPGMAGLDLAKVVTTAKPYEWREAEWDLHGVNGKSSYRTLDKTKPTRKVIAYDFGVKRNILRMLTERGCELTVVPAQTSAAEVLAMNPEGVFFSNGPGDPEPWGRGGGLDRPPLHPQVVLSQGRLRGQQGGSVWLQARGGAHRGGRGTGLGAQPQVPGCGGEPRAGHAQ
jgi:carbamoyl-phosphate synthase small subunit